MLTEDEHKRIATAVQAAEAKTSGEIHCVVSRQSDDYFLASGFVLACTVMLSTLVVGYLAHQFWFDISAITFSIVQILAFALGLLIVRIWPRLRLLFVPKSVRYRRAHSNAVRQFLAHNIHSTENRTGVLVFVSMGEKYAEIIADNGISDVIDQSEWNDIIAGLTEGIAQNRLADALVESVERCGELLAKHCPPDGRSANVLPDHVVEI